MPDWRAILWDARFRRPARVAIFLAILIIIGYLLAHLRPVSPGPY